MDAIISTALEEICSAGPAGLTLDSLWSRLSPSISLPLIPTVKQSIWTHLLEIPSLHFLNKSKQPVAISAVQSVDHAEEIGLVVAAKEHLRDSFLGIYHLKAREGFKGFNADSLNVLQRLATARENGVTQNQLATEFGKGGNKIFYTLKVLESQGLISRKDAVIHKTGVSEDNKIGITTKMVYLTRYAKNIGSQQRIEINQKKMSGCDGSESGTNHDEFVSEDVSVKDFIPAMKAICDKLGEADDKDLFVKDIKQALGYTNRSSAHKEWRHICERLKDAGLVKEYSVTIDNKPFPRLKLLRAFCFKTKSSECDAEDSNAEPANNSHGMTSEQVVELPIENQIYDMVDAAGSKGITLIELCERLCINNKRYYNTFISTFFKYGMPCSEEGHNKGMTYRVWTSRNFDTDSLNAPSSKLDDISPGTNANLTSHDSASQYATAITISESPHPSSNDLLPIAADRELVYERESPSHSSSKVDKINRTKTRENESLTSCISETDQQLVALEKTPQATSNSSKKQTQHKDPKQTAIRERRICERLQEKKFMIKHELKCWLESLEENKQSSMDNKTIDRLLIKLQEQGLCKCIKVSVPFSSNYTGQHLKDVVLHPSIQCTPEIYTQIQERLRCHNRNCRTRGKHKMNDESADPVLDKVHEAPKKIVSARMLKAMQANGFILSKIVRAKLLHIFLWDNLSGAPDQNDSISSGKPGYMFNDPHSTFKFFVRDDVIKAMPVELFYQIGGSTRKIDAGTSSCLCLKDLPAHEYKSLIDRLAKERLSRVFSVLERLKLIRPDQEGGPLYAYEQYAYIEEPRTTFSTTSVRHDFDLQSRENVNDYWTTLESLYSTADEAAAAHAFPGSSVRELSNLRSWAPYQLRTAEKRAEFLKPNVTDDPNKKLSVNDCEKVLDQRPKAHFSSTSRKRKRYSKAKEGNAHMRNMDERVDHEGDMNKSNSVGQFVEDANAFSAHNKEVDMNSTTYHESQQSEDNISPPFIEDDKHHPLVNQSFYPAQQIRFSWTREAERHLVIQYARDRASRGSRFLRTEWTSIDNLPAHPDACKRKMALLRGNQNFKSALNKLLNILGQRYVKYQENKKSKLLTDGNHKPLLKDPESLDPLEQCDDTEEKWDDFDCEDIKTALDDALQLAQVFKHKKVDEGPQSNKKRRRKSSSGKPYHRQRIPGKLVKAISEGGKVAKQAYESLAVSNAVELFKLLLLSTPTATEVPYIVPETLRKYSQDDFRAAFNYLSEKKILVGGSGGSQYELSQQFLQRFSASPFPADTGTRASKFANWIHEKEDDLIGEGTDLTPDLECGDILELFSLVATGELSMTPCLPDDGVGEPEDSRILKCQGDDGELINDSKAKRPKGSSIVDSEFNSRREKGFPGIKVSLNRTVFSSLSAMGISPDMKKCNEDDEYHQEGEKSECNSVSPDNLKLVLNSSHETCVLSDSNASPWDAMAEYTARLTLKSSDEESQRAFHPELFKDLYEAVKKAGDEGLTLNDISGFVDKQGNYLGGKMAKIAIEVLQAFGLTVQVNAYDCVHIVDSLYRSKYLLTSVTSSSRAMQQSSEYQVINDCARHKEQHAASGAAEYPLTETGVKNNHAHSVTILDHPDEVPSSLTENPCSQDDTLVYQCSTSSSSCFPIVPWMNGDGTVNKSIYKGLVRRVIGAVMQNPGMLEDDIIRRMDVLNPQSCKKLMELLILENHLTVKKMRQARCDQPPTILGCLLKKNLNRQSKDVIWRKHFFANPASCHLL